MPNSHKIVYAVYIVVWIIMAINPKYPADWLLENVLVFIFFPFMYKGTSSGAVILITSQSLRICLETLRTGIYIPTNINTITIKNKIITRSFTTFRCAPLDSLRIAGELNALYVTKIEYYK